MQDIDKALIISLIREVNELKNTVNMKGVAHFEESAEAMALRQQIVSLIGDFQICKILPSEFHVSNGKQIRHLGPNDN